MTPVDGLDLVRIGIVSISDRASGLDDGFRFMQLRSRKPARKLKSERR